MAREEEDFLFSIFHFSFSIIFHLSFVIFIDWVTF